MQPVHHKELVDLIGPVFEEGGLGQIAFHIFFVLGGERDLHPLRLHGHDIVVDDPLLDQPVDIGPVRGNQRCEFVIHVEPYGHLVFSHDTLLLEINNSSTTMFVPYINRYDFARATVASQ
jgi:hypothetical protein